MCVSVCVQVFECVCEWVSVCVCVHMPECVRLPMYAHTLKTAIALSELGLQEFSGCPACYMDPSGGRHDCRKQSLPSFPTGTSV